MNPTKPTSAEGIAYARAGLLGNPGDGYGGKAIATTVYDFAARVTIESGEGFAIQPNPNDGLTYPSLAQAAKSFEGGGCDDGLRLIRAAVKRFWTLSLDAAGASNGARRGAHIRYETRIPRQVGLSGSSALVIATIRALSQYFDFPVDPFSLAEAALAAEVEDLGIAAGAMDRVVQSYGGTMVMDLADPRTPDGYRQMPPALLPPLFLAWTGDRTKDSGQLHRPLRDRWEQGDPEVHQVINELRSLVDLGIIALEERNHDEFGRLMTRNFHLRGRIFRITPEDRAMVALAEEHRCPAKLAGSGGAIVGMIPEYADAEALREGFEGRGNLFLRPALAPVEWTP